MSNPKRKFLHRRDTPSKIWNTTNTLPQKQKRAAPITSMHVYLSQFPRKQLFLPPTHISKKKKKKIFFQHMSSKQSAPWPLDNSSSRLRNFRTLPRVSHVTDVSSPPESVYRGDLIVFPLPFKTFSVIGRQWALWLLCFNARQYVRAC